MLSGSIFNCGLIHYSSRMVYVTSTPEPVFTVKHVSQCNSLAGLCVFNSSLTTVAQRNKIHKASDMQVVNTLLVR